MLENFRGKSGVDADPRCDFASVEMTPAHAMLTHAALVIMPSAKLEGRNACALVLAAIR